MTQPTEPTGPGLSDMRQSGQALAGVLDDLEARSRSFGAALTGALTSGVRDGLSLEDVLRRAGMRLADIALSAGVKPLENMLGSALESGLGALTGAGSAGTAAMPALLQGLTTEGNGNESGLGVDAGSAAQAPAGAMPVGQGAPIVFNIRTEDAASFRRSEGQIAAMLSRTVRRGQRGL
ncbi:hypothetical protein BJF93_19420 [Xaviernesmea oryzae]|uniref:Phage tail tape measure protein n=1 Tax=Xaviernesmea oryzae TaxID=464029 RepID=A0A1Q9B1J0_9HYPH|nr:phage tail tape measure protein [Xaviernesmea oryzae]OLP61856.1 hypothetical protein BJF93_19420 [Xaviernesmea oryzae]SEL75277.1 hypothetical protein SAMN04487976_11256 [Xaviernesmea oryzae]